jgi:hypothetical protein
LGISWEIYSHFEQEVQMKPKNIFISGLCMMISGLGTGWLIGLSVSPIVHIVIGTLLSLLVALMSALAGLETAKPNADQEGKADAKAPAFRKIASINPIPVTVFIIGLAFGSSLGVYARTNEWLGMNIQEAKQRWKQIGFDDKEIKTLYVGHYSPNEPDKINKEQIQASSGAQIDFKAPPIASVKKGNSPDPVHTAAVFVTEAERCNQIRLSDPAVLKQQLKSFDDERISKYLKRCSSDACLDALRDYLCSK